MPGKRPAATLLDTIKEARRHREGMNNSYSTLTGLSNVTSRDMPDSRESLPRFIEEASADLREYQNQFPRAAEDDMVHKGGGLTNEAIDSLESREFPPVPWGLQRDFLDRHELMPPGTEDEFMRDYRAGLDRDNLWSLAEQRQYLDREQGAREAKDLRGRAEEWIRSRMAESAAPAPEPEPPRSFTPIPERRESGSHPEGKFGEDQWNYAAWEDFRGSPYREEWEGEPVGSDEARQEVARLFDPESPENYARMAMTEETIGEAMRNEKRKR